MKIKTNSNLSFLSRGKGWGTTTEIISKYLKEKATSILQERRAIILISIHSAREAVISSDSSSAYNSVYTLIRRH